MQLSFHFKFRTKEKNKQCFEFHNREYKVFPGKAGAIPPCNSGQRQ